MRVRIHLYQRGYWPPSIQLLPLFCMPKSESINNSNAFLRHISIILQKRKIKKIAKRNSKKKKKKKIAIENSIITIWTSMITPEMSRVVLYRIQNHGYNEKKEKKKKIKDFRR